MNLTKKVLKEGLVLVEQLEEARAYKKACTGAARNATKERHSGQIRFPSTQSRLILVAICRADLCGGTRY